MDSNPFATRPEALNAEYRRPSVARNSERVHRRQTSIADMASEFLGGDANVKKANDFFEDNLERLSRPIRPWLPSIGRFLIIFTFIEDAFRILAQMNDQLFYLQKHRGIPWGFSHLFLYANVIIMLAGSGLVMSKKLPELATAALFAVVLAQGIGYGLIFEVYFFLRNLSVVGGLLMVLSDTLSTRKGTLFATLPSLEINDEDRRKYFQLAGRILLIFTFIGFILNGKFTFVKALVSITGLAACVMVAVGFKAKSSALYLVVVLSIYNTFANNFWSLGEHHPQRDFLKYDFFQTLSIIGGLLLLVNLGAGQFSVDYSKKQM